MKSRIRAGIVIMALTGSAIIIVNVIGVGLNLNQLIDINSVLFYILQFPVFGALTAAGIYLIVTGKKAAEIQDDELPDNKCYQEYISYRRKSDWIKEIFETVIWIIGATFLVILIVRERMGHPFSYNILIFFGVALVLTGVNQQYIRYSDKKANQIIERGGISDIVEKMKAVEMQRYAQKQDAISDNQNSKASFGCGILSILFSFTVVIGIIFGITAIVVARKAKKEGHPHEAGLITGITGTAESLILAIIIFVSTGS